MKVEDWLAADGGGEADFGPRLLRLAGRGELGWVAGGLLLDLPALSQPWACASALCTPGRRAPGARSCCADLALSPEAPELEAIAAAMPEIAAFLAPRDPRWVKGAPEWREEGTLRRPQRRCVFALLTEDGLRCGLHALEDASGRPRGALKPMACRVFPLVLFELDDGRTLLSAIHRDTARLVGSRPARAFPCLGAAPTRLAEACAETLAELFGARRARAIRRAVAEFAEASGPGDGVAAG